MTDKEIEKALAICLNNGTSKCKECPYFQHNADCIGRIEKDALDYIKRLKAENKELQSSIAALDCALDISNNKPYRKKFLEEVWQGEMGNKLSEPDSDLIYELYFKEREKSEQIRKETEKEILGDLVDMAIKRDLTIDDISSFAKAYGVEVDE